MASIEIPTIRVRRPYVREAVTPKGKKGKLGVKRAVDVDAQKELPWEKPTRSLTAAKLEKIRACCHFDASPSFKFIANYIGVHETTLQKWLRDYRGLRAAIERWRAEGIHFIRRKAVRIARKGDGKMIRYILDRRDPDFRPTTNVELHDVPANYDRMATRPDVI